MAFTCVLGQGRFSRRPQRDGFTRQDFFIRREGGCSNQQTHDEYVSQYHGNNPV